MYQPLQTGDRVRTIDGNGPYDSRYGTVVTPCDGDGDYGIFLEPKGDYGGQVVKLPQHAFWKITSENTENKSMSYPQNVQAVPLPNVCSNPAPVQAAQAVALPSDTVVPVSTAPTVAPVTTLPIIIQTPPPVQTQPPKEAKSSSVIVNQSSNHGENKTGSKRCFILWAAIFGIAAVLSMMGLGADDSLEWLVFPIIIFTVLSLFCCSCLCMDCDSDSNSNSNQGNQIISIVN